MNFQFHWHDGCSIDWVPGKVVCVGRNYAAHADELNNPVPDTPLLFMKPATTLVPLSDPIRIPQHQGEVHFETELAVLVGQTLSNASAQQVRNAIAGVGLALDLTLRDLQSQLKADGHPWERAKAFDGACPLSGFIPLQESDDLRDLTFSLSIDGERRQSGQTRDMIVPVVDLLMHISQTFTLQTGDVVLTGTPAGVGALRSNQTLTLDLEGRIRLTTHIL